MLLQFKRQMLMAIADFYKPGSNQIKGSITFTQTNNKFVRVDIDLIGVPFGIHGIHVHEKPLKNMKDLTDTNCCDMLGGHFNGPIKIWSSENPRGTPHGSFMFNTERHIGDLCNNIISDNDKGIVEISYNDYLISLVPKHPNCIVGRSIIIHDEGDDEGMYLYQDKQNKQDKELCIQSKITGNSGKRIACTNIISINV